MKNNKLKIILSVLCASALNIPSSVQAQNKYLTSGTVVESGSSYQSISNRAALEVAGNGVSYSGTDITLSTTLNSGNGKYGAYVYNQGDLTLTGGTLTSTATASYAYVVYTRGTSSFTGNDLTAEFTSSGSYGHVFYIVESSTLTLGDSRISTNSRRGDAVRMSVSSFSGERLTLDVLNGGNGLYLTGSSRADLNNVTINVSGTENAWDFNNGIMTSGAGNIVTGSNVAITVVASQQGKGLLANGANSLIDIDGLTINASGSSGDIQGIYSGGDGTVKVNHAEITVTADSGKGILAESGGTILVENSTVQVSGSGARGVALIYRDRSDIVLNNVDVTVTGEDSNGVLITGKLIGRTVDAHLTVNGGSITAEDGNAIKVGSSDDNFPTATVTISNGAVITGNVAITGSSTLDLGLTDSTLTGDLTASGSSTTTVNLNDSSMVGDVTQNDDSTVTINLDNDSSGTGGFNGGNLNINDSESSWTFNQDSHVNDALNKGTLNIGNQDVTFDNLTHNGKINIDVNSDNGAGGSVNVTGTAGGNGSVHVDTTGNGSLDPNSVLPGLVSGDGTENWTWDPVDWGLEKVIKDGNHFTRDGISSAGAVLNSSNAVQQAMWFAQQNSLLKRMGELRFAQNSEERKVKSGDGLVENVWIRSYGQQLNVGGKVSGHSYEQMVYGVDLGTDHKWTLDDHNVVYTGVYAGYGRSDIDYRVAGTEGTLNSYYGGLYATWLHDSGLYVDLTFKAASVDNELKAPYGANQLTAEYNDLNLGGSIEIGKKFTFKGDWFIEPQAQVNYLHILAEDYRAAGMSIEAQDLDALQFRIGSLFGRTIKLANGGAIQPYLKVSGVEMVSSGGAIRNGYQSIRSNIDGARAELGGGIIWQMDDQNQLHFDYEASFGDKYDKPWGLTAGFRHQF